jgi:molybdopterin-guanine dinucleotide biosynthesis protein A
MRQGAIILCGGKSSRMGRDKATLPFGPELMLQRVVRLVSEVVDLANMVIISAPQQKLPDLPSGVAIGRDQDEYRGPLAGLATGLQALESRIDAVYVTSCDVPLLEPAFVRRMFELLGDYDVAVPFDGEHHHPLAAVYRPGVLPQVERLLADGRMRPFFLFSEVATREVPVEELRAVDPKLGTLLNLNREAEYQAALATAGYTLRARK